MAEVLPIRPHDSTRKRRRLKPLVVDAKRLARLLSCGVRTVRTLDASGKLPKPLRIGGSVVWILDEIRAWLTAGAPDRETWEARKAILKHPQQHQH